MFNSKVLFVLLYFCTSFFLVQAKNDYKITLLSENEQEIIIEFELYDYTIQEVEIENNLYKSISFEGSYPILDKGWPEIHKIGKSIVFLFEFDNKIEILEAEFEEIENILILPSKGNIYRNLMLEDVESVFSDIYNKNIYFPGDLAKFGDAYRLREIQGRVLHFYPIQFNPLQEKVKIYKKVVVRIKKGEKIELEQNISTGFNQIYEHHFLNFTSKKYTPIEESGSMLIVTHPDFENLLDPFILWKRQRGMNVEMVNTNTTGTSYVEIKNFITEKYNQDAINFVLLVGDYDYVSPFYINNIACDPAYGYIEGDDSYAEVIIGRFSGTNNDEITTQVERSIYYEKYLDASDNWLSKYMLIASSEGPGDDNEYDYEHLRNIKTDLLGYTYSSGDEMYDGSQGEDDLSGSPNEYMVRDSLNAGRGILHYAGHGVTTQIITSGFSNDEVNQLSNVNMLPFATFVGCITGEFAGKTCLAETLLRATHNSEPTGAIAAFASTIDQSWSPPMSAQDEMVDIMIESYEDNIRRTFGGIAINGCLLMNDQYGAAGDEMTDTWTIFGDPSIMVRTKIPEKINLTYIDAISTGQESYTIHNIDQTYAFSLTQNDSVIGASNSRLESVDINFSPIASLDPVILTITGFNRETLIDTIEIIPNDEPYIAISSFEINANDGQVDYNEEISFNLDAKNIGLASVDNIYVKISTDAADVEIQEDSVFVGSFEGSQIIELSNVFETFIKTDVDDGTQVTMFFEFSNGTLSWNSNLNFVINAPQLKVVSSSLKDSIGNDNNRLDQGELGTITFDVANIGHSSTSDVEVNILEKQNIQIINNVSNNSPIVPFDTTRISLSLYTSSDFNLNDESFIIIEFSSLGSQLIDTVYIPVGSYHEDFEKGNFLSYAWDTTNLFSWIIYDTATYNSIEDTIKPFEGRFAICSPDISHNTKSEVSLELDVIANDVISFYIRVSCEDQLYLFYDYLEFLIDDVSQMKWDGEVPWTKVEFPVERGLHTFTWKFKKDGSLSAGEDAAWVDYISLPVHSNISIPENQFSFASNPDTTIRKGEIYEYEIDFFSLAGDFVKENVEVTAYQLPEWLNLSKDENSIWKLSGTVTANPETREEIYLFAKHDDIYTNQTYQLRIDYPVSINKLSENKIEIYPNPFKDQFIVKGLENHKIEIFDLAGNKLSFNRNVNNISIDAESGVYLLKVENEASTSFYKIVKTN